MLNTTDTKDTLYSALHSLVTSDQNSSSKEDEIAIVVDFMERSKLLAWLGRLPTTQYPSYMLWTKAMEILESTERPHEGLNLDLEQTEKLHSITDNTSSLIRLMGNLYDEAYKKILGNFEKHLSNLENIFKNHFLKQLNACETKISLNTADSTGLISLRQLFPDMPESTLCQILAMPESNQPSIPVALLVAKHLGMTSIQGSYTLTVHPAYAFLKASQEPWHQDNLLGIMSMSVHAVFKLRFTTDTKLTPFYMMAIKTDRPSEESYYYTYTDADFTTTAKRITTESADTAAGMSPHDLITLTKPHSQTIDPKTTQAVNSLFTANSIDNLMGSDEPIRFYLPEILSKILLDLYTQAMEDTVNDNVNFLDNMRHDLEFYQQAAEAYAKIVHLDMSFIDPIKTLFQTDIKKILNTHNFHKQYTQASRNILKEITDQGVEILCKIQEKARIIESLVDNYHDEIQLYHHYLHHLNEWRADAQLLVGLDREREQLETLKQNLPELFDHQFIASHHIADYPLSNRREQLLVFHQELTKHGFEVEAPDSFEDLKSKADQDAQKIYDQTKQERYISTEAEGSTSCLTTMTTYHHQTKNKIIDNIQAHCQYWREHYQLKNSTPSPIIKDSHPYADALQHYENLVLLDRKILEDMILDTHRTCGKEIKTNTEVNEDSFLHLMDDINILKETDNVLHSLNKIESYKRGSLPDKKQSSGSFGVPGAQAGEIQPYSFSHVVQEQLYFWQLVCHYGDKLAHYFLPEECPIALTANEQIHTNQLQHEIKQIRHELKSLQKKGVINDPNLFAAHLKQLDTQTMKLSNQIARIVRDQQALKSELKNIELSLEEITPKLDNLVSKEKFIQDVQKSYTGNKPLIIEYHMFGKNEIVIKEQEDNTLRDDYPTKAPLIYLQRNSYRAGGVFEAICPPRAVVGRCRGESEVVLHLIRP